MRIAHARRILLAATTAAALLVAPAAANANSYWVSLDAGRGEIKQGVNGFSWHTHGGPFNTYASHCDALPGSYVAGAYCILRFNVPAGLTAGAVGNGGIARGQHRTANPNFFLRREKPGANPATVVDTDGDGDWAHGWGALGAYVDSGLRTSAATTTSATSNWFHANTFDIVLHDPSAPTVRGISVGGGAWKGPGCTPVSYSWSDDGSQLWSASLSNVSTGAGVHGWTANPGMTVFQSGVPSATFDTCLPTQPTGSYTYRAGATDRSGNGSTHDFVVNFDTTAPSVGQPTHSGTPIADGAAISSTYRPAFTWSAGDAHSGVAGAQVRVDGTPVPSHSSGGSVTSDLAADLALGEHTISLTVTDAAGNSSTHTQRIRIVDATKPQITFSMPARTGGNNPVLDVSAADDRSGIASRSWTALVNGEQLAVASSNDRLLAELGYLVDGTHEIEVRVTDNAGNVAAERMTYIARSGNGSTPLPGIDGLYVLEAPAEFEQGTMTRIRAAAVRKGRPLAGLRAEIHQGDVTIAGKPIAQDGTVDIAVTVNTAGPLVLTVNGSGLPNQTIEFRFIAKPGVAATVAGGGGTSTAQRVPMAVVARVINGDTIRLRDGRTVRLLQVDAPEASECFGGRATASLRRILRPGVRIGLQADARLGTVDADRRLLRYVLIGRTNVNRMLVQRGAATPHFVGGKRGRLASPLLADARAARSAERGLWKACPDTKLTPTTGANTGPT